MPNRSLNFAEAAEIIGISKRSLQGTYQTLGVPYYRIGRRIVFRSDDLELWFQEQRIAA